MNFKPNNKTGKFLSGLLTFHLVGLGWIIFASLSLSSAKSYIQGLLAFDGRMLLPLFIPIILITSIFVFGIDLIEGGCLPIPAYVKSMAGPFLSSLAYSC
jgi:hypothetical protein